MTFWWKKNIIIYPFLLFLFIILFSNNIFAGNCIIDLNPLPKNNIYYTNVNNTVTAEINGGPLTTNENVRIGIYSGAGTPYTGCPQQQNVSLSSTNTGTNIIKFSCNLFNIPDDTYYFKVDSSLGSDKEGNCISDRFCTFKDSTNIVCVKNITNSGIAAKGLCGPCGYCDKNENSILDAAEKPIKFDDCMRCIDGMDPVTNGHVGSWTAFGCIDTTPEGFTKWLLDNLFFFVGGLAFLVMLFGVFTIITSSGNPEKLNTGKDLITAAVTGLFLILFSILILKIIGKDILGLPDFK